MKMNIPTFTAEASLDILAKIKYQGNISIGNTSSDNAVKMAMMSCFRCWILGGTPDDCYAIGACR